MATLLTDSGEFSVKATDGTWLQSDDIARATGFRTEARGHVPRRSVRAATQGRRP